MSSTMDQFLIDCWNSMDSDLKTEETDLQLLLISETSSNESALKIINQQVSR